MILVQIRGINNMSKTIVYFSKTSEDNEKLFKNTCEFYNKTKSNFLFIYSEYPLELIWKPTSSSINLNTSRNSLGNTLRVLNMELDVRLDCYHKEDCKPKFEPIYLLIDNYNFNFSILDNEYEKDSIKQFERLILNAKLSNINILIFERTDQNLNKSYAKKLMI